MRRWIYHRRIKPSHNTASDHVNLAALGELISIGFPDPALLFEHGLSLLVDQLALDAAVLARITDLGFEATWWKTAQDQAPDELILHPESSFAPWVLEHPDRILIIRDVASDPRWSAHPAHTIHGIQAYMGLTLHQGTDVYGVLSLLSKSSRSFSRSHIALASAVANLVSKSLEVEVLRYELLSTRDALDLTHAVVQDSALENPQTGLPNRYYLGIWLKANLFFSRRRGIGISLVRWKVPLDPDFLKKLRQVSDALRGEDLLVDMGNGEVLLLLPNTGFDGTQILLERIRAQIGLWAMGATIWDPLLPEDRNDLELHHALRRAEKAQQETQALSANGTGPVVWNIPWTEREDA